MTIATATPTASAVPKADGSGKLADGWLPAEVPLTDENNTFTKAQKGSIVTLTDNTQISMDLTLGNVFSITLGGNRTLANPSNINSALWQPGLIVVRQDVTGSRTLSYGSYWKFPDGVVPVLSTGSLAYDLISFVVVQSTIILCTFISDIK